MNGLSYYLVFLAGMLTSLALKESFYFLRKMIQHTPYMLELRQEEKILKLRLNFLTTSVGTEIQKSELEMLKILYQDKTGEDWLDSMEYEKFKDGTLQ